MFTARITHYESLCDKCNKAAAADNPILSLSIKQPGLYHCIYLHTKCMADIITVATVSQPQEIKNGRVNTDTFFDPSSRSL